MWRNRSSRCTRTSRVTRMTRRRARRSSRSRCSSTSSTSSCDASPYATVPYYATCTCLSSDPLILNFYSILNNSTYYYSSCTLYSTVHNDSDSSHSHMLYVCSYDRELDLYFALFTPSNYVIACLRKRPSCAHSCPSLSCRVVFTCALFQRVVLLKCCSAVLF